MRDDDPRPVCEECCLLVLNLVSSTLPCIRQPGPDSACLMFVVSCKYAHRRS
jgi:hypothetical protein